VTTAPAAAAAAVSLVLSTFCVVNFRGCTLWLAQLIDRYLLIGALGYATRVRAHRPTLWVLRALGLWSAISSVSSLAALAAR
jgi:hypothetical protein